MLAHPTTGGVLASFASLGDVLVAEPGALMSFAGPRVVQQTTREKLPDDFGLAEANLRYGHVDAIVPRPELKSYVARLLRLFAQWQVRRELRLRERLSRLKSISLLGGAQALRRARAAAEAARPDRRPSRPRTRSGARSSSRATRTARTRSTTSSGCSTTGSSSTATAAAPTTPRSSAASASFDGRTVALVGQQKGRDVKERTKRNFGMAYPEGYRKAMRVMKLADRFGFPLVTLVDTPGAYPGVAAEQHGQGGAIARSQATMLRLGVPIVSVVIGEGGSGGAIAIAVGDRVLMQENAIYSVISPEGCAAILWRDASEAKKAAAAFKPDAAPLPRARRDRRRSCPEPRGRRAHRPGRGGALLLGASSPGGPGRAGRRSLWTS